MIGENIKKYRKELRLTQKELARRANISETALINYEKNRRTPPVNIIDKISNALGVSPFVLLGKEFFGEYMGAKFPEIQKSETEYYALFDFLRAIGYEVAETAHDSKVLLSELTEENIKFLDNNEIEQGFIMAEYFTVDIQKGKIKITISPEDFTQFIEDLKEIISFKLWQWRQKQGD